MRHLFIMLVSIAILIPLCLIALQRPTFTAAIEAIQAERLVTKPDDTPKQLKRQSTEVQKTVDVAPTKRQQVAQTPKKKRKKQQASHQPTIVIDPSHQQFKNIELEAVAPNSSVKRAKQLASSTGVITGQKEYAVTMTMAKKLKKQLQKKGYRVVLTRTKHDVQLSNKMRAKKANDAKADLVISLHADGGKSYQRGFYVMTATKKMTPRYYQKSEQQAKKTLKAVAKHDKIFYPGLFKRDDSTLLNYVTAPAISIQLGFLTNGKDDQKLARDAYLDILAKWIASSVKAVK